MDLETTGVTIARLLETKEATIIQLSDELVDADESIVRLTAEIDKGKALLSEGVKHVDDLMAENKRLKLEKKGVKSCCDMAGLTIHILTAEIDRLHVRIRELELSS